MEGSVRLIPKHSEVFMGFSDVLLNIVLPLVCGLALFLYGMDVMGDALKRSAGNQLKAILGKLTSNPFKGFLLGLGVTCIIQSSSATTVMVVGFVTSGTMTLAQSVGVIMGANVGTAITSWLTGLSGIEGATTALAWLKPDAWMPILALIGIGLLLFTKRGKKRDIGIILLGFAVLMVGMDLMSGAVAPLKTNEEFKNLFIMFKNPVLGLLAGVVLTAIVQSSSASVGILQSLTVTGAITCGMTVPIVMGQSIGTCVTALISSISANRNGKRAAIIHLAFNILSAAVWLTVFLIVEALVDITAFTEQTVGMFGVAGIYTCFKLLAVLLFAPMTRVLEKIAYIIVPEKDGEQATGKLLDARLMTTPSVAVERATEVTGIMARSALRAMQLSLDMLENYDPKVADEIRALEGRCDNDEDELGSYLVQVSACNAEEEDSHQITKLLHLIGDFERLSDHAVNILESAEEIREKKVSFSEDANRELAVMRSAIREIIDMATNAFIHNDLTAAGMIEPLEEVVDDLRDTIKRNHILRLQKSACTIELGFVLNDLLTNFERVADHCPNIGGCVVEIGAHNTLDLHRYIAEVKGDPELFQQKYREYSEKYAI